MSHFLHAVAFGEAISITFVTDGDLRGESAERSVGRLQTLNFEPDLFPEEVEDVSRAVQQLLATVLDYYGTAPRVFATRDVEEDRYDNPND